MEDLTFSGGQLHYEFVECDVGYSVVQNFMKKHSVLSLIDCGIHTQFVYLFKIFKVFLCVCVCGHSISISIV